MKDDIEKVGESTFSVVQCVFKAKNNGLKKEERVGALLDFIQVHVGVIHIDYEVDCTKLRVCLEHAQSLVLKAEALCICKKTTFWTNVQVLCCRFQNFIQETNLGRCHKITFDFAELFCQ